MRNSKILVVAFLTGLIFISGCKKKTTPEPSDKEKQTTLLSQTWNVKTDANSVTLDGNNETDNWPGFSITIKSDGSYTASGVAAGREVVWPTAGTWQFKSDTELNTVVRDDGVEISIVVDDSTLKLSFTYSTPGGRTSGTDGAWIFNMQQ